ncbi:MAG TPA: hypothetical protein VJA40_03570 [archaeon]|nr:hypothetical protein [archaeon]
MADLLVYGTTILAFLTFLIALFFFWEARKSKPFLLLNVLFLFIFLSMFVFHWLRLNELNELASQAELALVFFIFAFAATHYALFRRSGIWP